MDDPLVITSDESAETGLRIGLNIDSDEAVGKWDVERNCSSEISLLPTGGFVRKQKKRHLDKTIYEAYATIFFGKLADAYTQALRHSSLAFFSPQTIRVEHDSEGEEQAISALYQLLCPGNAYNHMNSSRQKGYAVGCDSVRSDQRAAYLAGGLGAVLKREGVVHGDPQIRHFFFLPKGTSVTTIDGVEEFISRPSYNGIGIIDVELARLEDSASTAVISDQKKFRERMLRRFKTVPEGTDYFLRGEKEVAILPSNFSLRDLVQLETDEIFARRFPNLAKSVDMKEMNVLRYD